MRAAILIGLVCLALPGCETYRSWRYPCESREPGMRGEVMRGADGKFLYFDGECWTSRAMPPGDTPF
jgi:hypothetical protein